jgi:hypothetical protein
MTATSLITANKSVTYYGITCGKTKRQLIYD